MVSKRTGIIITAILAVLFGCAGIFTCAGSVNTVSALLRNVELGTSNFGSGLYAGLGANICTSLGFIALPIVFYIVLVANNQEASAQAPAPSSTPKDTPAE